MLKDWSVADFRKRTRSVCPFVARPGLATKDAERHSYLFANSMHQVFLAGMKYQHFVASGMFGPDSPQGANFRHSLTEETVIQPEKQLGR